MSVKLQQPLPHDEGIAMHQTLSEKSIHLIVRLLILSGLFWAGLGVAMGMTQSIIGGFSASLGYVVCKYIYNLGYLKIGRLMIFFVADAAIIYGAYNVLNGGFILLMLLGLLPLAFICFEWKLEKPFIIAISFSNFFVFSYFVIFYPALLFEFSAEKALEHSLIVLSVCFTILIVVGGTIVFVVKEINDKTNLLTHSESELQDRNRDLADARQRAEAASQAKSDFLANMSHEIRTPLNGLIGIMQTLQADKLDADSREVFAVMTRSARSLKTIVNNILDISKIEAKRMVIHKQDFDIVLFIRNLTDIHAINFANGKKVLRVGLGETVPRWLNGDRDKLEQILSNLLSNASKFTEEGQVRIDICKIEKSYPDDESMFWLRFVVSDTGIGIPPDQQESLFQPFSQIDGSLARKREGTGLGLAIIKELVELMGGSVSLESAVGEGSAFTVDLPFPDSTRKAYVQEQKTDPHVVILIPDKFQLLTFTDILESVGTSVVGFSIPQDARLYLLKTCNSLKHVFIDENFDEDGAAFLNFIHSARPDLSDSVVTFAGGTEKQGNAAPKLAANYVLGKPLGRSAFLNHMRLVGGLIEGEAQKAADSDHSGDAALVATDINKLGVLVVDDNKINQRVLVRLLSQMNIDAEVASSGEAAIERVEQGGLDIVLMDVQMPGMDGYQATVALREKGFDDLKIIACTAHAFETDRELAWQNGMDGHISKPVDQSALEELLNTVAREKMMVVQ